MDPQVKQKIYQFLVSQFPLQQPIHMAQVMACLTRAGYGHDALGFAKSKQMLQSMPEFLTLEEELCQGVPRIFVTITPWIEPQEVSAQSSEQEAAATQEQPQALPAEWPASLWDFAFLPWGTMNYLYRLGNAAELGERTAEEVLTQAYDTAQEKGGVISAGGMLYLPLDVHSTETGDLLYAGFVKNINPDRQPWFLKYIGPHNQTKEEDSALDEREQAVAQLKAFAYLPLQKQEDLVRYGLLTHEEERSTPMALLAQAYQRAVAGDRIQTWEEGVYFETGIPNARGDMLCAFFVPNTNPDRQAWYLKYIGVAKQEGTAATEHTSVAPSGWKEPDQNLSARREQATDAAAIPQETSLEEASQPAPALGQPAPVTPALKEEIPLVAPMFQSQEMPQETLPEGLAAPHREPEEPYPPVLEEFAFVPHSTLLVFTELVAAEDLEDVAPGELLNQAYQRAVAEGRIYHNSRGVAFFTGLFTTKGAPIHAGFVPNRYPDGQKWVLNFVGSGREDPDQPAPSKKRVPGKALENFAYLGNWSVLLDTLSKMALKEDWDFNTAGNEVPKRHQILRQYLNYTFYRLQMEGKVCISSDGKFAAFNTGLVNSGYDEIYACFVPYESEIYDTKWRFSSFCLAGDRSGRGDGKTLVKYFHPLPQVASYFNQLTDLLYDPKRDLIPDKRHIIVDNIARLPMGFLREECNDPSAQRLLDVVEQAQTATERKVLFTQLAELIESNARLNNRLCNRLQDAIDLAVKRVTWNYKTAIPLYYPKGNCMSLMLPLSLQDDTKADAALVTQLVESGVYQGQTILTLDQAYVDARLICRPDSDWLNPGSIHVSSTLEDDAVDEAEN